MESTLKERLYAKLPERPGDGCWVFTGATNGAGYGNIYLRSEGEPPNRRTITVMTHRASYEIHEGPIPDDVQVLHHCDNPSCCNPDHLFLGDQAANMQDKSEKGRAKPGPVADPVWWTEERRAERARLTAERARQERERKQRLAGVSKDTKFCPTCRRWLSHGDFGRNRARRDGLQAHCKVCKSADDIARRRRKNGQTSKPRRATRSDKKHFL